MFFSFYKALSVPVGRSQCYFINMKQWNASQNMFAMEVSLLKYERFSWVGKESACNAGDPGSIPGLGRSPGERKGYPLQYSSLENSMDSTVHGVTKSWARLSDFHFTYKLCSLFITCLLLLKCKLHKDRTLCLFCSLMYTKNLEQCLAQALQKYLLNWIEFLGREL